MLGSEKEKGERRERKGGKRKRPGERGKKSARERERDEKETNAFEIPANDGEVTFYGRSRYLAAICRTRNAGRNDRN